MGELQHLSPTASADDVVAVLRSDGAVVIDDLAPPDLLDRLDAELEPWLSATPYGVEDFAGRSTRRTGALTARCPASRELLQHPLILDATRRLLEGSTTFHVHLTQAIAIGPGSRRSRSTATSGPSTSSRSPRATTCSSTPSGRSPTSPRPTAPPASCPGSNRGDVDRLGSFQHDDTVPAEMARGSVLVYSGSVHHGGGANTTDEVRVGVNLTYARSWLRQEENQYLAVPMDVARTLDDDLLRLLGFTLGAYALGYVGDGAIRSTSSAARRTRASHPTAHPAEPLRDGGAGAAQPGDWIVGLVLATAFVATIVWSVAQDADDDGRQRG